MKIFTNIFNGSIIALYIFISSCKGNDFKYINPNKLLQGYHGAQAQHELFQAKARDWQLRIDSLGTELQALHSAPPATRAAKEQQLGQYREAIQQRAQQENQRLTQAVLAEINAYLKQYGKQQGYTFILGATESGNIVYAADEADITDDVLQGLNAQYDRQHPAPTK
ncbi:MAG: OmpH family outer membrane protein [Janthinobacterium lividum]